MIRTFRSFVALAALLLMFIPAARALAPQAVVSSDEATLKLKDTGGRARSLMDHRGKIVVLNFWATWCRPCREDIPILVSLDSRYRERGVEFIAADHALAVCDDVSEEIENFGLHLDQLAVAAQLAPSSVQLVIFKIKQQLNALLVVRRGP